MSLFYLLTVEYYRNFTDSALMKTIELLMEELCKNVLRILPLPFCLPHILKLTTHACNTSTPHAHTHAPNAHTHMVKRNKIHTHATIIKSANYRTRLSPETSNFQSYFLRDSIKIKLVTAPPCPINNFISSLKQQHEE